MGLSLQKVIPTNPIDKQEDHLKAMTNLDPNAIWKHLKTIGNIG